MVSRRGREQARPWKVELCRTASEEISDAEGNAVVLGLGIRDLLVFGVLIGLCSASPWRIGWRRGEPRPILADGTTPKSTNFVRRVSSEAGREEVSRLGDASPETELRLLS